MAPFRTLLLSAFLCLGCAFQPTKLPSTRRLNIETRRFLKPPGSFYEEESYGLLGSAFRQGPVPVLQRLTNNGEYEMSVYNFMNAEGVSRIEAQANIDAYLANPNDWAVQRQEDQRKGTKTDYVNRNMEPASIAKTVIWGTGISALIGRTVFVLTTQVANGEPLVFKMSEILSF